jgi:hypothetical protein
MVRLRFDLADRREGDLLGVHMKVTGEGVDPRKLRVDFDDRNTIVSNKGDQHAFNAQGIAVEGYQKSNLKGEGRNDLHYGVLVKDIPPEFKSVRLQVLDVENEKPKSAEFSLPTLGTGQKPIISRAGFEVSETFPPPGWQLSVLPSNICRSDPVAALTGSRGLLCQDLQSVQGRLIRAGLRFALLTNRSSVRPMSLRLRAHIKAAELEMERGRVIHPLAFLAGNELVAAACVRKVRSDALVAGVLIRSPDGLSRKIFRNRQVQCELELLRLGTRQTTAALWLENKVVARISGDTTSVEPDACCVGILHRHSGLQITLHVDQLLLTEAPR